jgi:hypothetical protein
MKLPHAERALVDVAKLRDYCLDPNHPKGKHKAKAFRAKLGITRVHAERLREVILEAILTHEASEQSRTAYGRRYTVDFPVSTIEGPEGLVTEGILANTATIRTAWIIRDDEDFPRLTTCFTPRRSA